MKRTVWIVGGLMLVALLLAGGAFMTGRLLGAGRDGDARRGGSMIQISSGDGQVVEAEFVKAEALPDRVPDVAGVFERRLDNSIFVNETEGGFRIAMGEDDSLSVTNATGKITEIVVTSESLVYVDETNENIDAALSDGKLHQKVEPGVVEEIGELSYVRAWGEMRGDRLIASVLVYNRPPVISR
jgi:hypothetical protein